MSEVQVKLNDIKHTASHELVMSEVQVKLNDIKHTANHEWSTGKTERYQTHS